jgi:hypothetical protein
MHNIIFLEENLEVDPFPNLEAHPKLAIVELFCGTSDFTPSG